MSSSIQRGGYWWNQGPDGTWLRWSPQDSAWEPQPGGPPPPGAPPPPPPPVPAGVSAESPAEQRAAADGPTPSESQAVEAPGPQLEQRPEDGAEEHAGSAGDASSSEDAAGPPLGKAANAPIFSTSGTSPHAPFENKVFVGVVGAIIIIMAFFGTYKGANIFFSNAYGSPVSQADKAPASSLFSPAKSAYIAKVDRLCSKHNRFAARFQARLLTIQSPRQMERLFERASDVIETQLREVEGVPKPKEDRRLLNRIIRLQRGVLPFLDRMLAAVQARNDAAVDGIAAEAYADAAKSRRLMGEYGFEVCGKV